MGGSGPGGVCSGAVWSQGGLLWGGGGSGSGGGLVPGVWLGGLLQGVWSWGGAWSRGAGGIPVCTEAEPPLPNGQTDTCKNITLAQLRCGR